MKIIVDAMGGDNAPQAPVMGAVQANREYGVDIILVGRGEAILKVLEEARSVYDNRMTRIPTARLNEEMLPLIEAYPPPATKGKYIKIKYITQLPNTQVPSFVYFANLPQYVKEPYKRFLENKMREKWNLTGTPVNIYIRQK